MDKQKADKLRENGWVIGTLLDFLNQGVTDPQELVTEEMLNARYAELVKEGKFMPNPCTEIIYPQPTEYIPLKD
jgi:hypothetical protein